MRSVNTINQIVNESHILLTADVEYREAVGVPRIIFASEDRVHELIEAGFENIVVYRVAAEELPSGVLSFHEVLEENPGELEDFEIEGDPSEVLAVVTFTGGTTGNPKPIQLTHKNVVSVLAFEANG